MGLFGMLYAIAAVVLKFIDATGSSLMQKRKTLGLLFLICDLGFTFFFFVAFVAGAGELCALTGQAPAATLLSSHHQCSRAAGRTVVIHGLFASSLTAYQAALAFLFFNIVVSVRRLMSCKETPHHWPTNS